MEKELVITRHKYTGESAVTSVRLPKDMLDDIERVADETGRKKNDIIEKCIEFALSNMQIK